MEAFKIRLTGLSLRVKGTCKKTVDEQVSKFTLAGRKEKVLESFQFERVNKCFCHRDDKNHKRIIS